VLYGQSRQATQSRTAATQPSHAQRAYSLSLIALTWFRGGLKDSKRGY
jgi:hypothetical protein